MSTLRSNGYSGSERISHPAAFPGSARASRASFGAPPKRTFLLRIPSITEEEKVHDGGAPSPACEGACAPQMLRARDDPPNQQLDTAN